MKRPASDWYERIVRPLLFRMDPERAHHLALWLLRSAPLLPGAIAILRSFAPTPQPKTLFGLQFRNPIGLAAGFDKDAVAIPAWEALGFGFVEVGTVTSEPQPGNSRPRIFRYPNETALINRLGFNNQGAAAVADRLRRLRQEECPPSIPIGVNIGKSRRIPLAAAANDYLYSFRQLHEVADYVTLNLSSPNTPGLRSLQEEEALIDLLQAVVGENARLSVPKPILLKIDPDLSDDALMRIAATAEKFSLSGMIATNTTLNHGAIDPETDQAGGLSGEPLRMRSTRVIEILRGVTRLPIIGVGGIGDLASAREKVQAGADLLQIYTGLIYRGPGLLREIADA